VLAEWCQEWYYAASCRNDEGQASEIDTADMKCGPAFDAIRHKVMLEALLKGIPEICHSYTQAHARPEQYAEHIGRLERDVDLLKKSLSWRLTAPLRKLADMIRR
jgi:hypothetical protein